MLVLDELSCADPPALSGLNLVAEGGDLPAVVCSNQAERKALVDLLSGERTESGGQVLLEGEAQPPRQRRAKVVILPVEPTLSPHLSAKEHVRVVASMRRVGSKAPVMKEVLEFSGIANPNLLCQRLTLDQGLKLSIALALLGRPSLAVALDPPEAVQTLLPSLRSPGRVLLVVAPEIGAMAQTVTHLWSLAGGKLEEGASALMRAGDVRRFLVTLSASPSTDAGPKRLFEHNPGVDFRQLSESQFLLEVRPEGSAPRILRTLIQAGFRLATLSDASSGANRR